LEGIGIVVSMYAMKAYGRVEIWFHCFLILAPNGVDGHLHATATLSQEKNPQCPLNKMLDRPQSWTGRTSEEIHLLSLLGIKTTISLIFSL
jgi:hypothetical protein